MKSTEESMSVKICLCLIAPVFAALGSLGIWLIVCMVVVLPILIIFSGAWYLFGGVINDSVSEWVCLFLAIKCTIGVSVFAYLNTLYVCITGRDNWFSAACLTQDKH